MARLGTAVKWSPGFCPQARGRELSPQLPPGAPHPRAEWQLLRQRKHGCPSVSKAGVHQGARQTPGAPCKPGAEHTCAPGHFRTCVEDGDKKGKCVLVQRPRIHAYWSSTHVSVSFLRLSRVDTFQIVSAPRQTCLLIPFPPTCSLRCPAPGSGEDDWPRGVRGTQPRSTLGRSGRLQDWGSKGALLGGPGIRLPLLSRLPAKHGVMASGAALGFV